MKKEYVKFLVDWEEFKKDALYPVALKRKLEKRGEWFYNIWFDENGDKDLDFLYDRIAYNDPYGKKGAFAELIEVDDSKTELDKMKALFEELGIKYEVREGEKNIGLIVGIQSFGFTRSGYFIKTIL